MKMKILPLLFFIAGCPFLSQSAEIREYDNFLGSLADSGTYVFENLGKDLAEAVRKLGKEAPGCVENNIESLDLDLDDGSKRFTMARNNSQLPFPCGGKSVEIVQKHFDKVDKIIRAKLADKYNSLLDIYDETSLKLITKLNGLPTKSHLHVYKKSSKSPVSQRLTSLPFHTDNGLYLLLTPSRHAPIKIRYRNNTVADLVAKNDSVIFMAGTGLTSWLLPDSANLVAAPHAVPSINKNNIETRTVFARMKVAPMMGLSQHSSQYFKEHFYKQSEVRTQLDKGHQNRMKRMVKRHDSHHWPGETSTGAGCNTYLAWDGPNLAEHTVAEGAEGSDECAGKCRANKDCAAWTVNKCNGWCALKVDKPEYNEQENKNFISGRRASIDNAKNCAYAVTSGACN